MPGNLDPLQDVYTKQQNFDLNITWEYILVLDSQQISFTYLNIATAFIKTRTLAVKFCIIVEPLHMEWTIACEIDSNL